MYTELYSLGKYIKAYQEHDSTFKEALHVKMQKGFFQGSRAQLFFSSKQHLQYCGT